jgi:hypothetical protein
MSNVLYDQRSNMREEVGDLCSRLFRPRDQKTIDMMKVAVKKCNIHMMIELITKYGDTITLEKLITTFIKQFDGIFNEISNEKLMYIFCQIGISVPYYCAIVFGKTHLTERFDDAINEVLVICTTREATRNFWISIRSNPDNIYDMKRVGQIMYEIKNNLIESTCDNYTYCEIHNAIFNCMFSALRYDYVVGPVQLSMFLFMKYYVNNNTKYCEPLFNWLDNAHYFKNTDIINYVQANYPPEFTMLRDLFTLDDETKLLHVLNEYGHLMKNEDILRAAARQSKHVSVYRAFINILCVQRKLELHVLDLYKKYVPYYLYNAEENWKKRASVIEFFVNELGMPYSNDWMPPNEKCERRKRKWSGTPIITVDLEPFRAKVKYIGTPHLMSKITLSWNFKCSRKPIYCEKVKIIMEELKRRNELQFTKKRFNLIVYENTSTEKIDEYLHLLMTNGACVGNDYS